MNTNPTTALPVKTSGGAAGKAATDRPRITREQVWQALSKASFTIVSHLT